MKTVLRKTLAIILSLVVLIGLCASLSFASAQAGTRVTVSTDKGTIAGIRENGIDIFKGIPYAKPPVGKLRWKAPQPVKAWTGVKECTTFSANAMQNDQVTDETYSEEFIVDTSLGYSEDCLYLNVWSKDDGRKNKPVIVYIHGGGFAAGGASCEVYDGVGIAEKGTVFVNFNYRLGAMGFYTNTELTEESENGTSGNYALLDMIAALKWVKHNAASFGGDASNITVVGQSAGACCTELLAASPKAKGLFQKAVVLSFPQIKHAYRSLEDANENGDKLAQGKSLNELRSMSAKDVMAQFKSEGKLYWSPIRDGKIVKSKTRTSYLKGTANDIPILYCSVPGDNYMGDGIGLITPGSLTNKLGDLGTIAASAGSELLNTLSEDDVTLSRDLLMANYYTSARARTTTLSAKTYLAYFDYVMPGPNSERVGAFHTSDVPYWLNHLSDKRSSYWTEADRRLADTMSSYLVNFARTGNPNGTGLPRWNAFDGSFAFQNMTTGGTVKTVAPDEQQLWENYSDYLLQQ